MACGDKVVVLLLTSLGDQQNISLNYRDLFQMETADVESPHIVIFDGATDVLEPITVSLANFPGYTNGLRVISDLVKFGDNNEDNIICITDPTWYHYDPSEMVSHCSYEFYLCDPITYANNILLAGGSVEVFSDGSYDNACDICRFYCPTTSTTPAPTTPTPTTPTTSTTPTPTTPTPTTPTPTTSPCVPCMPFIPSTPDAPSFSLPTTKNGVPHSITTTTIAPISPLMDVIVTTTPTTTSTPTTLTPTTSKPMITTIAACKVGCNSLNF